MTEQFRGELLKDERILWSGQPETKIVFSKADIFLIPFSILWGGFAIFWEAMVLFMRDKSGQGAPVFVALFGIPFVFIGLHMIFGRFIWKNFRKKKTYYAVTDKRVIVLTNIRNRNVQAEFINKIANINKSIRVDGIGTIRFGNSNIMSSMYGNTGMDFFGAFYGQDVPAFYDIKDADRIYGMVNELRNQ